METNLFTNAAAQSANPAGVAINGASSEGRDMFTKLLVAQIRNQDPLSPQDPSQFVQQLTQLSQSEALQNLASLTSANASVLQSMQVLAMGAQVGSDVLVQSDQVQLDTRKVEAEATLGSSSAKTSLLLTASNGQQVELVLGSLPAGTHQFSIDPVALGLQPGTYSMRVVSDSNASVPLAVQGRLDSVQVGAGGNTTVKIDSVGEVAPSAITAFRGKAPASAI
ncbi:flagellar basal body rod modification protein [Pseudoduganella eburnea]|uniref:Basal-body rod modification protein FlgD n=1 Tax=Massilia eburnea TaxID=1776165 RepID=A0A6L6QID0_9BURK|nr:flagellar hook capping FlgD N-terminal domain-containing protein [Massilia eburnea]MTW12009.1 flagellar basal body rod modification protein [Massilia eburnea]